MSEECITDSMAFANVVLESCLRAGTTSHIHFSHMRSVTSGDELLSRRTTPDTRLRDLLKTHARSPSNAASLHAIPLTQLT